MREDVHLPEWDTPATPVDPEYAPECCPQCGAYKAQCQCPWYVNVFLQTQERGGPEEGGWYYYAGQPIESRKVNNERQAERTAKLLRARYSENNERLHDSFWTKYDSYVVLVERGFATPYPAVRPHYE